MHNVFATDLQLYEDVRVDGDHKEVGLSVFNKELAEPVVLSYLCMHLPPGSHVPSEVLSSEQIKFKGVSYSTSSVYEGNSNIFF